MPREIFGEVVDPGKRLGSQARYTLTVSIAAHVAIAAGLVIVPLMASDVLPTPRTVIGAFAAQPSPPPPPPPVARSSVASARKTTPAASSDAAPIDAPDAIAPEPATTGSLIGDPHGIEGGLPDGLIGAKNLLPEVPAVPAPPPPPRPLPVGGKIKEPAKIRHVPPVYPVIAQQARVEGIVIIAAVIGVDGRVKEARVLASKPLLDDAALTAVRQWEFTPTTLNGVPVPVIMTVTVNFRLN